MFQGENTDQPKEISAWWQYQRPAQLPPFWFLSPLPDPKVYCCIFILSKYWNEQWVSFQVIPGAVYKSKVTLKAESGLWWLSTCRKVWGLVGKAEGKCYTGWPRFLSALCSAGQRVLGVNFIYLSSWDDVKGCPKEGQESIAQRGKASVPRKPHNCIHQQCPEAEWPARPLTQETWEL